MAPGETATIPLQQEAVDYLDTNYDLPQDDDMYYGDGSEAEGDDRHMGIPMSRLSIESSAESDAGTVSSDGKQKKKEKTTTNKAAFDEDDEDDDDDSINRGLSLPGTPARRWPRRRVEPARPVWLKEYASETEARGRRASKKGGGGGDMSSAYYWRRPRRGRESRLERAWEMRRCRCTGDGADSHSGGSSPCVVVRPRGGGAACMCMDMDEVRACRDLGLELPRDWTVEIPAGAFHGTAPVDTSSGGDSPVGSWRISSPGDDPRDVKARLRVWAQAVALASRLGS